jgi:hypothetical protein
VLHGPAKLDAVVSLADEHGINLSSSSAYSDSVNDRPLLEGVGHPVAVNPDRMLRELAAERGWPVQDFRRRRRFWLIWVPAGTAGLVAAVMAAVGARRVRAWRRGSTAQRRTRAGEDARARRSAA